MKKSKSTSRKLAVLDLETDPFAAGRVPQPFLSGYYDGSEFSTVWDNENCITRTAAALAARTEPLIIYAHNGGKFDWFFFLEHISDQSTMRIVNGRIIQAYIGKHEVRDSYSIMPFPLAKYNKLEIDHSKLERSRRRAHKDEIIEYLRVDCVSLYELVIAFWDEFGDMLTVGSTGLKELRKFHKFAAGGKEYDARVRAPYYYGGRVQVFKPGIVDHEVKVLDVNSMYPDCMAHYSHPVSCGIIEGRRVDAKTCFVTVEGDSFGAFAVRNKDGIDFPHGPGIYSTTIHEFNAALDTRTFKPRRIIKTLGFNTLDSFDTFVYHYYDARKEAIRNKDKVHDLFYKYILNSTYGKFAQNPENFSEYVVTPWSPMPEGWEMIAIVVGKYIIWGKPIENMRYFNISTAASITGAARSKLLRALAVVSEPCYCDTDSIIAAGPGSLELSETELGSWKTEATARSAAFAGKKLYGLYDGPGATGTCVKKAHKGGLLTGDEIRRVALGETIHWESTVPNFKLSGLHGFIERNIKRTV